MSDPFQVFSAKKFPGMIESTALSKKFASQGIRIPVRHAGDKNADDDDDETGPSTAIVPAFTSMFWLLYPSYAS
jgi:hypothetical protein